MNAMKLKLQAHMVQLGASLPVQRWHQLAGRERWALLILGLVLLVLLTYGGLWMPVERSRAEAMSYFQQQRDLHAYLQARAPEARATRAQAHVRPVPAGLQRLVTAAAERHGLAIERLDAEGEGGVQVSLQPAQFASLLAWFETLQSQGIRIEEAGLERHGEGMVAARLGVRPMP